MTLDFQGYGSGLVTVELMYFFRLSPLNNYNDIVEITKGSLHLCQLWGVTCKWILFLEYHRSLVSNGVDDYSLEDFLIDVQIGLCENLISSLFNCNMMKPDSMKKMMEDFVGKEKSGEVIKILEKGSTTKPYLILTGMYLQDKENFLNVKQ